MAKTNKGGCKIGRKDESPNGGCKVGKRNRTKEEKDVAKEAAEVAKKSNSKTGKSVVKVPFKKKKAAAPKTVTEEKMTRIRNKVAILNRKEVALKKKKARLTTNTAKALTKEKVAKKEKKTRIQQKVKELGKAQIIKKREVGRKIGKKLFQEAKKALAKKALGKRKALPAPRPQANATMGQKLTGLTKEQMNKLSPTALFGMLPVALAKKVLDPKTTGVIVGKPTPYTKEQGKVIERFMEEVRDMYGFRGYVYGWSFYDGGNFNEYANTWFERQANRLDKFTDLGNAFNELVNEKKIEETGKVHDLRILEEVMDESRGGERWYDNYEYEEYYPSQTYGLIYDGDDDSYNFASRTRSTTKKYVSDVIKGDGKRLMALWKEVKKIVKKK